MIARPESARPRHDLPWLRHRTLRRPAAPAPTPTAPAATAPPARGSTTLDLSRPAPAAAPPPAAAQEMLAGSSSLDLFPAAAPAPAPPSAPAARSATRAAPPARVSRPVPRVRPGERKILTERDPTVTLNRVQSGIGTLRIEAVCSPAVGPLVLGVVYQLADGTSGIVQPAAGITTAPPASQRPVISVGRGQYQALILDLRQARTLARLLVYAHSGSAQELAWGGTLVVATYGGGRVELPLDLGRHAGPIALLSLYDVDGEFVLRGEREKVSGPLREVARSFGYDQITWADDWTPVR